MSPKIGQNFLDELLCRFIINLPEEELVPERVFFHIQEAHWYYSDFLCPTKISLKKFANLIFKNCHLLQNDIPQFDQHFKNFNQYIQEIPVYGAIILNKMMDKILLVMNYNLTSYSFPKGKVNMNETGITCATREVWEEIGFNIQKYISESDYIEYKKENKKKISKMYIVSDVQEETFFRTNTRCEIGKIQWVLIEDIENRDNFHLFEHIIAFVKPLKIWIQNKKEQIKIDDQDSVKSFEKKLQQMTLIKNIQQEKNPFRNFKLNNQILAL